MTQQQNEAVAVTQDDYALAEEVVSAANIVSHDGYYEVDIAHVAEKLARHRLAAEARLSHAGGEGVACRVGLARLLCNDMNARRIAEQDDAPLFDDSASHVQAYWLALADSLASHTIPGMRDAVLEASRALAARVKAIAARVVQDVCEQDPADPDHPDTASISVGDLETIIIQALDNAHTALPVSKEAGEVERLRKIMRDMLDGRKGARDDARAALGETRP
jgi:hypothetical protein